MMDAPVNAVDDQTNALTRLVASQPLVEHATDNAFADLLPMQHVARGMAIPCQPVAFQRPVHGLDDVAALAEFPQDRLGLWRHDPTSRFNLGRHPHTLQLARPINQQCPVLAERVAHVVLGTQIVELMLPLLGDQHPVEPGETIGIDLTLKLLRHLELGLAAQLQGDDLAGSLTDAVGDVVASNVEGLAVVAAPVEEGVAVRYIALGRIDLPFLTSAGHAVTFDITQMRVHRLGTDELPAARRSALRVELHDAGLHCHPPRPRTCTAAVPAPCAPIP